VPISEQQVVVGYLLILRTLVVVVVGYLLVKTSPVVVLVFGHRELVEAVGYLVDKVVEAFESQV